jgi:CPA2 family monovalent cation:H+ antiporter-2
MGEHLLSHADGAVVLLITALTMAAIPLTAAIGSRLAPQAATRAVIDPALPPPGMGGEQPQVIIAGFGRVGQTVAALLERHGVPYVAIDRDPDRVARERRQGRRSITAT